MMPTKRSPWAISEVDARARDLAVLMRFYAKCRLIGDDTPPERALILLAREGFTSEELKRLKTIATKLECSV